MLSIPDEVVQVDKTKLAFLYSMDSEDTLSYNMTKVSVIWKGMKLFILGFRKFFELQVVVTYDLLWKTFWEWWQANNEIDEEIKIEWMEKMRQVQIFQFFLSNK